MGVKRGLVYYIDDENATGLDKIPVGMKIMNVATGDEFKVDTNKSRVIKMYFIVLPIIYLF